MDSMDNSENIENIETSDAEKNDTPVMYDTDSESISDMSDVEKDDTSVISDTDNESVSDMPNMENRKNKKRIAIAVLCAVFLILAGAGSWIYIDSLAYKVCRVEAGVAVAPLDFLKKEDENAAFAKDSEQFDITEPGEYHIRVKSGLFTHSCTLVIQDTIAPQAQAASVRLEMGDFCEAKRFVTDIADATQVAVTYETEPDFTIVGLQPVQIALTDKGGNRTIVESELFITQVIDSVTIEAGDDAPGLDSFVIAAQESKFITDISKFDYTRVGDHKVRLKVDGETYTSVLHIADTIPPKAKVHDIEGFALLPRKPEDFVTEIEDVTEVTTAFRKAPDLAHIGTQELELVFTDGGNNEVVKQVKLTLIEDTETPVIHGAADLRAFIGASVSYKKNVTVTDNCVEGLSLTVDTSAVNLSAEGAYPVTYTARDAAGNTASATVTLSVVPRVYDINEVNALADSVIAGIITPDMGERDKITAIYNYVKRHVTYINSSEKGNYVRAAYEGLVDGKGDCYVFASTSKVMLTRAGITNMDIAKIPTKTMHYWNLVFVDGGWYHFDTTPRKDRPVILMWTDAQLMDFSARHNNCHDYDHSAYPPVQ